MALREQKPDLQSHCRLYPQTVGTPAVAVKNIHFCVNKCGFEIVAFFHASHRPTLGSSGGFEEFLEKGGYFRFEKATA